MNDCAFIARVCQFNEKGTKHQAFVGGSRNDSRQELVTSELQLWLGAGIVEASTKF
jgi:hypothetical protein